jgi:uncharacterized iron-regulated membrane protein
MAFWMTRKLMRARGRTTRSSTQRRGAATIDYVLILAFILPLVGISIVLSREVLGLVYEVLCVLVSWPFM